MQNFIQDFMISKCLTCTLVEFMTVSEMALFDCDSFENHILVSLYSGIIELVSIHCLFPQLSYFIAFTCFILLDTIFCPLHDCPFYVQLASFLKALAIPDLSQYFAVNNFVF